MGKDEQKEEREVLDSIFPDEIQDISETEYRVSIALDPGDDAAEDGEPPTLILRVQYPEEYPDVAPDLDVWAPPNAPKYKNLDVQEDKARLLESLQPTIDESMGMAMVFALVSTLKDSAELLISERQKATQALKEVELRKAEEEENRKFQGTVVTKERFLDWQAKFKVEIEELEKKQQEEKELEDRKKRIPVAEKKLTGKELWDKGLAGKAEEEEVEGDDLVVDTQNLKVES